jgi:large conductance mechanosensitive channel
MGLLSEFKQFAMRGNVIDLAVGVVIGAAFGKIVNSLVNDLITPPIGYLTGRVKFTDLKAKFPIGDGNFLQVVFEFIIVAFCVFLVIKGMNVLWRKKQEAPKPAELTTQEKLLIEIRDLLRTGPASAPR